MASASEVLSYALTLVKHYPIPFLVLLLITRLLWNKFQPGLAKIPGPTTAAYTGLWRVYSVWRGSAHLDAMDLHKRYGNLVRIGPNHVSIADPKWIPVFYGIKEEYTKVCQASMNTLVQSLNTKDRFLPNSIHLLEEEPRDESVFDKRPRIPSS